MKLNIKHIAPYLPYKLKFMMTSDWFDELPFDDWNGDEADYAEGAVWEFAGYVDEDLCLPLGEGEIDYVFRKGSTYISIPIKHGGIKPILKSLSELTVEDDNGSFLIDEIVNETEHECDAYYEWRDSFIENDAFEKISQAPHEIFQKLIERHYDVYGLINVGLAVEEKSIVNL